MLKNLLFSGYELNRDSFESKQIQLVNFIMIVAMPIFLLFTFVNAFEYQVINGIILLVFGVGFFRLRQGMKHYNFTVNCVLLGLYLSHVAAIFQGGILNSGFLWMFLFPLFALFLGGSKRGKRWLLILFITIVLSYGLIKYFNISVPYTPEYLIFIILVLAIESWYVLYAHKIQSSYEGVIQEKNDALKTFTEQLELRVEQAVKENRQKDIQLSEQGRMAAMGEMMSNIAHQWKQPLGTIGVIVQNIQLGRMLEDKDTDKLIDTSIQEILRQTELMNQTIKDFTNYVKPSKVRENFDIQQAIDDALKLVESNFKRHNIAVVFNKNETKLAVNGLKNEFMHVIINVVNNAKDAFLEQKISNGSITIDVMLTMTNIEVSIKDNAGGIPKDVIDYIFNPYFTTKDESTGTGIGLYMSRKMMVESFDGLLDVKNIENGACFTLTVKRV